MIDSAIQEALCIHQSDKEMLGQGQVEHSEDHEDHIEEAPDAWTWILAVGCVLNQKRHFLC